MDRIMRINVTEGWAIIHDDTSGMTAIAKPTMTEDTISFKIMGWHSNAADAESIVSAFVTSGVGMDQAFSPESAAILAQALREATEDEDAANRQAITQ